MDLIAKLHVYGFTKSALKLIHERSLRILYKDYRSSYAELLQKDNSVAVVTTTNEEKTTNEENPQMKKKPTNEQKTHK